MAQLDPGGKVRPLIRARSRYELKIHDLDPEDLIPLGDRYIVEQIDIDETVLAFANILVMTQAMGQKPGEGPGWFRGEFVCPANFMRRTVRLSAPDIDSAIGAASAGAAGCTVELADQTTCPWTSPSCEKRSVDFRQANVTFQKTR